MKQFRRTKKNGVSSTQGKTGRQAALQNQTRQIFCRFVRATIFTKRVSFAVGAAVCLLIMLAQPATSSAAGVSLGWNPSSDTNVVGYNVYYGGASGDYTNEIFVGDVTNVTITGLSPGATYYFSATSVSADGAESDFSAEVIYTVPNPVVLAMNTVWTGGAVSGIMLTATGDIPAQWTIESSPDLQTWTPLISGTNSTVNVTLPVTTQPQQFFRLVNQ